MRKPFLAMRCHGLFFVFMISKKQPNTRLGVRVKCVVWVAFKTKPKQHQVSHQVNFELTNLVFSFMVKTHDYDVFLAQETSFWWF